MLLTSVTLDRFKGGQAEIQNPGEGYLCRGEIKNIFISADWRLTIHFAWLGKMDPPMSGRWVNETSLNYAASLRLYSVSEISGGCIVLTSQIMGDITALFPADGSKLDPARVEGLELTTS